jgi:hypothetical protein
LKIFGAFLKEVLLVFIILFLLNIYIDIAMNLDSDITIEYAQDKKNSQALLVIATM